MSELRKPKFAFARRFKRTILAGRRINEGMGAFVAQRLVKHLALAGVRIQGARVGLLGITFKQDVLDLKSMVDPSEIRPEVQYWSL